MCYLIYSIGYKISDEIKLRKENEKPAWWHEIHPSIKDHSVEDVEKILVLSLPPEKIAEMTRHEKYLAVSNASYIMEIEKNRTIAEELETLKAAQQITASSSFIDEGHKADSEPKPGASTIEYPEFSHDPLNLPVDSVDPTPNTASAEPGSPVQSDLPGQGSSGHGGPPANPTPSNQGGAPAPSKNDIRKHAQLIVRNAVNQINQKSDEIPEEPGRYPEQELFQAVLTELQNIKQSQPQH